MDRCNCDVVVSIDDMRNAKKPKFVVLAMCILCLERWIATVYNETPLFKMECRHCGARESFASFIPEGYLESTGWGKG